MNICANCKHVRTRGFRGHPGLWECVSPGNGTSPQTGKPERKYCDKKNPLGKCSDFVGEANESEPELCEPTPVYRSPLWVRVLRWLIQGDQ